MNWFPTGFTRKSGSTGKKRNWIHHLPKSFSLAPGPNRSMSAERDIFFRAWTVLFERESVWPARTFYCSRRRKVDQGQELKLKKSRVDHGAPWRTMPARGVPFFIFGGLWADHGGPRIPRVDGSGFWTDQGGATQACPQNQCFMPRNERTFQYISISFCSAPSTSEV